MTAETRVGREGSPSLPTVTPVSEKGPSWWARRRSTVEAWGFMAPAAVLVLVFFFLPMVLIVYMSFLDIQGGNFVDNPSVWAPSNLSLDQYTKLFHDRFLFKILTNTLLYVIVTLILFNVGLALVISLLTTHIQRRVGFLFRLLWILPRITPVVIYVLMWKRIGGPEPFGILNDIVPFLEPRNWIFDSSCLLPLLCDNGVPLSGHLTSTWLFINVINGYIGASFGMIIFSSAIESIPQDYIRAAMVDGASALQRIRYVIIPMIKWPLLFVTTFQAMSLLTSYVEILLLTNGGPGLFHSEVWALTSYKRAFSAYFGDAQYSYGAAWSVMLVIVGVTVSAFLLWKFRFADLVEEPKIDAI